MLSLFERAINNLGSLLSISYKRELVSRVWFPDKGRQSSNGFLLQEINTCWRGRGCGESSFRFVLFPQSELALANHKLINNYCCPCNCHGQLNKCHVTHTLTETLTHSLKLSLTHSLFEFFLPYTMLVSLTCKLQSLTLELWYHKGCDWGLQSQFLWLISVQYLSNKTLRRRNPSLIL